MTATAAAATKGRNAGRGTGFLSLFTLGATPSRAVRGGLRVASLLIPLLAWAAIASWAWRMRSSCLSPGRCCAPWPRWPASCSRTSSPTPDGCSLLLLATVLAVPIGICMGVHPAVCAMRTLIAMPATCRQRRSSPADHLPRHRRGTDRPDLPGHDLLQHPDGDGYVKFVPRN